MFFSVETNSTTAFNAWWNCKVDRSTVVHLAKPKRIFLYRTPMDSHYLYFTTNISCDHPSPPRLVKGHVALKLPFSQLRWSNRLFNSKDQEILDNINIQESGSSYTIYLQPLSYRSTIITSCSASTIIRLLSVLNLAQPTKSWAVLHSAYNYVCFHIDGNCNIHEEP